MSTTYAVSSAAQGQSSSGTEDALAVVQPGETLADVAQRLGVSSEALHAANPQVLHPDLVRPGQQLDMPPLELHPGLTPQGQESGPPTAASQPAAAGGDKHAYVVQRGDTLAGIGRKLGLDWRTLAQINGVSDPSKLATGRTLQLDGAAPGKAPAAAAAQRIGTPSPGATRAATGAYSAQNLDLGVNAAHADDINAAAQRSGMAPQAVAALVNAEAAHDRAGAWNADSYNRASHAAGLTQFLPNTWVGEAQRSGTYLHDQAQAAGYLNANGKVAPEHRQDVLDMRYDARASIFAAADYAQSNVARLQRSGDLPANLAPSQTAQAAYLAHHEGPAGAARMINNDTSHITQRQYETNVPVRQQQRFLDEAGGDRGQAYRTWLNGYIDSRIDPRHFMADSQGVAAPRVEDLER